MKPNATNLIKDLITHTSTSDLAYDQIVETVAYLIPNTHFDTMEQLLEKPIWDGDVISKQSRDFLIEVGLAVRVCFAKDQGYTAATYPAMGVFKHWVELKKAGFVK